MKKNEKKLFLITAGIAVLALAYVWLIEPGMKYIFSSGTLNQKDREYMDIFNRRDEIKKQAKDIFGANYWNSSAEDRQINFQIYIEAMAKGAGINNISGIYPVAGAGSGKEISLQLELECSPGGLAELFKRIKYSRVPVQVKKLRVSGEKGENGSLRVQIELAGPGEIN